MLLSALLNRQVQQPIQVSDSERTQLPESSIEQQLKNFTDRLSNSQVEPQPHTASLSNNNQQVVFDDDLKNAQSFQSAKIGEARINNKENNNATLADFEKMQAEMASIRSLLEHQVSGLMWQDMAQKAPQRAVLVNRLLKLGLTD
jgi:flagellar biosynthesis protein FlhF